MIGGVVFTKAETRQSGGSEVWKVHMPDALVEKSNLPGPHVPMTAPANPTFVMKALVDPCPSASTTVMGHGRPVATVAAQSGEPKKTALVTLPLFFLTVPPMVSMQVPPPPLFGITVRAPVAEKPVFSGEKRAAVAGAAATANAAAAVAAMARRDFMCDAFLSLAFDGIGPIAAATVTWPAVRARR